VEFLQECWIELKKVHWPSRKETQAATIVVIIGGHDRRALPRARRLRGVMDHPSGAQRMTAADDRAWYVVHTYSGYEHKVKAALEERIRSLGKPDLFGEILVPSEKVVELVKGKKKTSSRKFFPATSS
jgi:hypothetical protein